MPQIYHDLLKSFAEFVNLPSCDDLLLTEEIMVDGMTVCLAYEGDDVSGDLVYFTVLGQPENTPLEGIYRLMLEGNSLWVGTSGATLGLEHGTGNVTLAGRTSIEGMAGQDVALLLDAFVEVATFWARVIREPLDAPVDEPVQGDTMGLHA